MANKITIMNVQDTEISVTLINNNDYICLTDMVKNREEGSKIIEKWFINKNTIEFLGIWEQLNNPDFNSPEFGGIMSEAGTNRFYISIKQWVEKTYAIGIISKTGKFGGTYAHKDIAFNFGLYISPMFNLLLIKEFQRLKEIENNHYNLEWNVKRILSKVNYQIHTKAIETHIIPKLTLQEKDWIYADEADMLNMVLFGCTAKQWREANPQRALQGENIRDMASINELAILSNMESINSLLIKDGISKENRMVILSSLVLEQKNVLEQKDVLRSIKKISESTYIESQYKKEELSKFNQSLLKTLNNNPNETKKGE